MLWTYADRNADGSLPPRRRRRVRRGDEHVRAGRVQRRRHRPRGRRLRAPLARDGLRRVSRARLRAPARPRVSAVAERQRRAVDAAGRHAEPERRARRAAGPVRLATRPTGWRAPCGRSARATARSGATTRRSRGSCAIASTWRSRALEREVLSKYPQTQVVDGRNVPAWLIVDGADATAEAMLGLAAYDAGGPPPRRALARFAEGVAALGTPAGNDVAVRRRAAVGAVALDLARLGVADAGRARRRGRRDARARRPARRRARRRGVVHAAPAGRGRAAERVEPVAERRHADRLRRGLAAAVAARGRGRGAAAGAAAARRDRGVVVLRQQPRRARRCTTPRPA